MSIAGSPSRRRHARGHDRDAGCARRVAARGRTLGGRVPPRLAGPPGRARRRRPRTARRVEPAGVAWGHRAPLARRSTGPWWRDTARGAVVGLSFDHDVGDMARAVVESVAWDVQRCLESASDAGADATDPVGLVLGGGGANSALWTEILDRRHGAAGAAPALGGGGVGRRGDDRGARHRTRRPRTRSGSARTPSCSRYRPDASLVETATRHSGPTSTPPPPLSSSSADERTRMNRPMNRTRMNRTRMNRTRTNRVNRTRMNRVKRVNR